MSKKVTDPPADLDLARIPRHIAVIMDGNGRWARRRSLPREAGHQAGIRPVHRIVEACARLEVEVLTLYAFSSENWARPPKEVRAIMRLFTQQLRRQFRKLVRNNVRFRMIGRRDGLAPEVLAEVDRVTEETRDNDGLILNMAVNYGGRQEIIDSVRALCREAVDGRIRPEDIDEAALGRHLATRDLPDPDLLIRTSGELRISNFLLWQLAYTELYATPVLWPDFDEPELYRAIIQFQARSRRFGGVLEEEASL